MNTSYQLIGLVLSFLNYAFIFLFLFSIFKVNYYNAIVSFFIKLYKPIGKVSLIPNQSLNIIFLAITIKFISLFMLYSTNYDVPVLLGVAVIQNLQLVVRMILFIIIGGVILSWVQPKNSNPFLEIILEISDKILSPLRGLIPSAGGLDFSPLFVFILIQLVSGFLDDILRYIV